MLFFKCFAGFRHIESRDKNNVTSLIKLQSASFFFLHMERIYIKSILVWKFSQIIHKLPEWRPTYYCFFFFFWTHPVVFCSFQMMNRFEVSHVMWYSSLRKPFTWLYCKLFCSTILLFMTCGWDKTLYLSKFMLKILTKETLVDHRHGEAMET